MRITVFTIFPELIESTCKPSLLGSAIEKGLLEVKTVDPRTATANKHRTVDDAPYGGGAGMVFLPEPISNALERELAHETKGVAPRIVFLTPGGQLFNQEMARQLAVEESIYLVCGRYKGIDDRVRELFATDEVSIGDYVLSGGDSRARGHRRGRATSSRGDGRFRQRGNRCDLLGNPFGPGVHQASRISGARGAGSPDLRPS
jgi:tRNA (guanine37-N1)-methyltransferase